MAATAIDTVPWTKGVIPYVFDPFYPLKAAVLAAMQNWQKGGVLFRPRRFDDAHSLRIRLPPPGIGNHTDGEGMQADLRTQDTFIKDANRANHELGHVLGLMHEMKRSDRDDYVEMQWANIEGGKDNYQFKQPLGPFNSPMSLNLTPYDPDSVMHYPAPAKGWGGYPTDEEVWTMRWRADWSREFDHWRTLSFLDIEGIRHLYPKFA